MTIWRQLFGFQVACAAHHSLGEPRLSWNDRRTYLLSFPRRLLPQRHLRAPRYGQYQLLLKLRNEIPSSARASEDPRCHPHVSLLPLIASRRRKEEVGIGIQQRRSRLFRSATRVHQSVMSPSPYHRYLTHILEEVLDALLKPTSFCLPAQPSPSPISTCLTLPVREPLRKSRT